MSINNSSRELTSTVLENVLESNRSCQVVTITAELSILVALGLNVGLEGSEKLREQTITNMKAHYCEMHELVRGTVNEKFTGLVQNSQVGPVI